MFSAPAALGNQQVSFGVGPNEIRNTTFDLAGSVNIDNPAVASYTVAYGSGAFFFEYTAVYTFQLAQCSCDFFRLHWINRLGGTDAYTFKSVNEIAQITTSDRGQKPLFWDFNSPTPHNINDGGSFKIDSQATLVRTYESGFLSETEASWLSQLMSSGEVYRETASGLVRIDPPDGEQQISTNNDTGVQLVRFVFKAVDSNQRIQQQN